MLGRRGDLLNLARVQQSVYDYVKGKSRSKRLLSSSLETPKPNRLKICAEIRQKRISALEDIASLDKQLHFKNKRLEQAENVRNYKLCEEITEEIQFVTKQKRDLSQELRQFREKERKARWYKRSRKGSKGSASKVTDDSLVFSWVFQGNHK